MTLIDTSAWIEFLRRSGDSRVKRRVADCIDAGEAVYTCPIRFELLAGARPEEMDSLEEALGLSERERFVLSDWDQAAKLERRLRSAGVTAPRDDIFIAAVALRAGLPILCKDRHFDTIRDRGGPELLVEQMA